MAWLGHLITLSLNELRLLVRDRQAAALLFGMPAVFILLLSLALKDVYEAKVGRQLAVVVEAEDRGDLGTEMAETLRQQQDLQLVPRPSGVPNSTLFRNGDARAVIRIPDGFSADARAFLERQSGGEFGPHRIEFETSPNLDASYRWLLEARLALVFMKLVQDELVDGQRELGAQLDDLSDVLESTLGKLEHTVVELQDAVGQLENMGRLLEGTPEDFQHMAEAAMVEQRAAEEAEAARTFLRAQGIWSDAGLREGLSAQPGPPIAFEPLFPPAADGSSAEIAEGLAELRARAAELKAERARRVAAPGEDGEPVALALDQDAARSFLRGPDADRNALPTPLQQTVPGWSLFAMFFLVVPLSQGLHRERAEGTLRRIRCAAVSPPAIVLGKLLPYVLVGVVQFAGMLAIGLFVVPALSDQRLDVGAQPLVLLPVTVACSLAAVAYALLVASWTRTPEQAAALGATSIIVLALLGGVMVPHFIMPAMLQDAARASPLYWGHRAYLDVFLHGAGLREVMKPLAVLGGFAAVCLTLASFRVARP